MSQLKTIVQNALEIKNVSPQIISSVDTLIKRAVIDTQKSNILPARKLTFTCEDRKQEYRDAGETVYNFFYLPEDFRKLDEFRPLKTYPYSYTSDEYDLYKPADESLSEQTEAQLRKKFTIVDNNFDDDAKYEKILIARPFPEDTETIQIKYYVNGKSVDYDWLGSEYYEVIINWIYRELGLVSFEESEDHLSRASGMNKEKMGSLREHGFKTLKGSYFGSRNWNKNISRTRFNNI